MKIECIWEHNGSDSLLYAKNCIGAFTRGASLEEAVRKMPDEIRSYYAWLGEAAPGDIECDVVQEKDSQLEIKDADRWQDIAIVLRSLEHNFSGRYNGEKHILNSSHICCLTSSDLRWMPGRTGIICCWIVVLICRMNVGIIILAVAG